jgi:hypothetical protein
MRCEACGEQTEHTIVGHTISLSIPLPGPYTFDLKKKQGDRRCPECFRMVDTEVA